MLVSGQGQGLSQTYNLAKPSTVVSTFPFVLISRHAVVMQTNLQSAHAMITAPSVTRGRSKASHAHWLVGRGGGGGVPGGEGSGGFAGGMYASSGNSRSARATAVLAWGDACCNKAHPASTCTTETDVCTLLTVTWH